jgi:hypothetical protein
VTTTPFAAVPVGAKPVPGERGGLPVVGITTELMRDPLGQRRRQYNRFGPVTWYKAFATWISVRREGEWRLFSLQTSPIAG